jgi:hypothetical protein
MLLAKPSRVELEGNRFEPALVDPVGMEVPGGMKDG